MNLDRHSLGIIISRVIGIYILLQAISYLAFVSTYFRDTDATWQGLLSATVAFLVTLGLSYFFLAHASQAGRFLMSDTHEGIKSETVNEASVVRTTFLIIGGYLIVQSLPTLVGQLSMYFQGVLVEPRAISYIAESSVRLFLALFLVIGGGSWERFLRKLRG